MTTLDIKYIEGTTLFYNKSGFSFSNVVINTCIFSKKMLLFALAMINNPLKLKFWKKISGSVWIKFQ